MEHLQASNVTWAKNKWGLLTSRIKPKPRSRLMNTSLASPYFANSFLKSSSFMSDGRLPTNNRHLCVNVFSPVLRKLFKSSVISIDSPPSFSVPGLTTEWGCVPSSMFGLRSIAGESVLRFWFGGFGEALFWMFTCLRFRFAIADDIQQILKTLRLHYNTVNVTLYVKYVAEMRRTSLRLPSNFKMA